MKCNEAVDLINDHIDGGISTENLKGLEQHLGQCQTCSTILSDLEALKERTSRLPGSMTPEQDLWKGIEAAISGPRILSLDRSSVPRSRSTRSRTWTYAVAASLVAIIGTLWFVLYPGTDAWHVSMVEGSPRSGNMVVGGNGELGEGEWLETDDTSRVQLNVGGLGFVDIEPNTKVRLVQAGVREQRMALLSGTMHATIWAPPRIFFVETPSATAIDLGCEYTLSVDEEGSALLTVTSGYVKLELAGRESIIPAGAMCFTFPGIGPGTPFSQSSTKRMQDALFVLDFENGGEPALDTVLDEADEGDALTLWHLLGTVDGGNREKVFSRLAAIAEPPNTVTREGILAGDSEMLRQWGDEIGLGGYSVWIWW